jgi:hypothetical protein
MISMPPLPLLPPDTGALAPNHDEIAQCARAIWISAGQPEGRDDAIWLDAERRLIFAGRAPLHDAAISPASTRCHTSSYSPAAVD